MKIPELKGKHVAIVAMGESQLDFHLSRVHSNEYDEVWGINCMGEITKCDRVFMLDPVSRFLDTDDAGSQTEIMKTMFKNYKGPIYTCELDERVPNAELFPLEEVVRYADCAYLNNTVPFAFAYALYQEVGNISIYGIDFSYRGNLHFAEAGKACCEFWLAKCIERGMTVGVGPRSGLLDTNVPITEKLYGYHRLDDPIVMALENSEYKQITLSEYDKKLQEINLKKLTEGGVGVPTVLTAPEAKRY
tara:strand:- start:1730 stop:2470 length:741 start_codon:yes stop_codon:yes gene_type:complete